MMDKPTKPIGRKAYGSIGHIKGSRLGPGDHTIHDGQSDICVNGRPGKTVWVQAKLDGSCVSVARLNDGELVALGRAGYPANTSPHIMHHLFADWVHEREHWFHFIQPGERVVGEWLAQAHGTRYDLRGRLPFVAFDIMRDDKRLTVGEFINRIGPYIPHPSTISGPIPPEEAMGKLDHYGAEEPEGVMYRVESTKGVEYLAKWVHADKVDGLYLDGDPVWNWTPEANP